MQKIWANMAISSTNIVWAVVVVGLFGLHMLFFAHVSDRLDRALERMDKLEALLTNTTVAKELRVKRATSNEKRSFEAHVAEFNLDRIDLNTKRYVHKRRDAKISNLWRKIHRLEKRVQKCLNRTLNTQKKRGSSRRPRAYSDSARFKRNVPACNSSYAFYTVWGTTSCLTGCSTLQTGQTVTTDGSDFLCLPDAISEKPFRYKSSRQVSSGISIRGVTYGDIEDVRSYEPIPPYGSKSKKNNRTVPCAICARCGKTSSVTILSMNNAKRDRHNIQREYSGVLMSTKKSNMICVSNDAVPYSGSGFKSNISINLSETDQLHPAELRCDSMYCQANIHYQDRYRVSCMVVTV